MIKPGTTPVGFLDRDYTLLTGATGQIGSYLLRDILAAEKPLAVVVRPNAEMSIQQRINEIVSKWEDHLGRDLPRPVCLAGDTTKEFFGLSQQDRHWVRANCNSLIHNAASVAFGKRNAVGATWDNNVSSAKRVVELCRYASIEHLAFVSTAYVCGQHQGTFYEHDLNLGQSFRNEYEHSKLAAEQIVREFNAADVCTIFRPSIVIGDYQTGQTASFQGFYRLVQFTNSISSLAPRHSDGSWRHNVRLTLTGNEKRNFVTVDWVSAVMTKIVFDSNCHGQTYHLTPQKATTTREIEDALQQYFRYHGVQFVGPISLNESDQSVEERRFFEYLSEYNDYWQNDPTFDRRNTDKASALVEEGRVDVDCLYRLIDFAVDNRFGRQRRKKKDVASKC